MNSLNNDSVKLSTITTDLVYKSIIIQGSNIAKSNWEKDFIIWLSERNQNIIGTGVVGFDILNIGLSREKFEDQIEFLTNIISKSIENEIWNAFNYQTDKPIIAEKLVELESLITSIDIDQIEDKGIEFLYHEKEEDKYKYCDKHLTLKIDNQKLGTHSCFICSTLNFIEIDEIEFQMIELSEEFHNGDFYLIESKEQLTKKSTIEYVDRFCNEFGFRSLGNLWYEKTIKEGLNFLKNGLTFDLAYTSAVVKTQSFVDCNYEMIMSKLNGKEIKVALTSANSNPWGGSYGSWGLDDSWTFNIAGVLATEHEIIISILKSED